MTVPRPELSLCMRKYFQLFLTFDYKSCTFEMIKIDESKIFLILCSCVVRFRPNARREKFSQTWRRLQQVGNDRKTLGKLPRRKFKAQILRNLRISVASSPKCHLIFDMPTSRPAFPYYSFRDIS